MSHFNTGRPSPQIPTANDCSLNTLRNQPTFFLLTTPIYEERVSRQCGLQALQRDLPLVSLSPCAPWPRTNVARIAKNARRKHPATYCGQLPGGVPGLLPVGFVALKTYVILPELPVRRAMQLLSLPGVRGFDTFNSTVELPAESMATTVTPWTLQLSSVSKPLLCSIRVKVIEFRVAAVCGVASGKV